MKLFFALAVQSESAVLPQMQALSSCPVLVKLRDVRGQMWILEGLGGIVFMVLINVTCSLLALFRKCLVGGPTVPTHLESEEMWMLRR